MTFRNLVFAFVAVVGAFGVAAGCGSSYDCSSANGKCAGDAPPSTLQTNECNGWLNDPQCGAAFRTYGTCILDNEECGADGGSGNFGVAQVSCPQEYSAWQTCCQDHADAGACPLTL